MWSPVSCRSSAGQGSSLVKDRRYTAQPRNQPWRRGRPSYATKYRIIRHQSVPIRVNQIVKQSHLASICRTKQKRKTMITADDDPVVMPASCMFPESISPETHRTSQNNAARRVRNKGATTGGRGRSGPPKIWTGHPTFYVAFWWGIPSVFCSAQ